MTAMLATDLQNQLQIARSEIRNLRKQINALTHAQQTDVKTIQNLLTDFKCIGCKEQQRAITPSSTANAAAADGPNEKDQSTVKFKPIGVIRTDFPEKRAVPRQPICSKLPGLIELNKDVFNNPEHSLDRLSDFSHLWIIYHFHKNDAHAKAKVAPPRLGGERVGIFSTRSPHRPCPIGLSLVEIERIEGSNIYFYGTDMVDGTPVLDLKPYIPRYDSPVRNHFTDHPAIPTEEDCQEFDTREEPDGEETIHKNIQQTSAGATSMAATTNSVKVPHWIMNDTTLDVLFNQRATAQIDEFHINRANIVDVLKNDPRSVYLKTRYGSQIFTFQLGEVTVTCKFDDANGVVTVVQIRKSENLSSNSNGDANAN